MYVGIGACVNLNVSLLGIRCTVTPSQLRARLLFKCNGNDICFCAHNHFDWIHGTVSRWRWTNRMYVGIGAHVNLNVPLLDIHVYDKTWNHHNYTFTCYSNNLQWQYARLYADIDWTYGTVSCLFWANRRYVGMFGFECLITWSTMTLSQLHARLLFNYYCNATCWCWCWLDVWNGVMLALNEQQVRWYECKFELECAITWYTACDSLWRHHNCTLAYYSIAIAMPHNSARWCWWWLNVWNGIVLVLDEQQVRCYWCMFEFECAIAWYTIYHEWYDHNLLHNYLLFMFNYNDYGLHTALCRCWCWLNTWTGMTFALNKQKVCWYWCMFKFECVFTWYTMHHETITIARSPDIQLQLHCKWLMTLRWWWLIIWNDIVLAFKQAVRSYSHVFELPCVIAS